MKQPWRRLEEKISTPYCGFNRQTLYRGVPRGRQVGRRFGL